MTPAIDLVENLPMKKKIVYTDEPMGDVEVAADFLPSKAVLHHGTRSHGTGRTLDCSHGWRAPTTFDACHHALGRAHACSHIALRQARLRACGNQFAGQRKLGRLCVIG